MKKMIALIFPLTASLLLGACQKQGEEVLPSEQSSDTQETKTFVKTGKAKFKAVQNEEISYEYRDDYFLTDSSTYNEKLRHMAFVFTLTAFDEEGEDKAKNINNLFDELSFEDKVSFDYEHGKDTIATNIAHRNFKDDKDNEYTLLTVALAGYDYKKEWASNVTVGSSGDHKGFSDSAALVEERMENYVSTNGIDLSKTKVLLTGFSRGAAIANIVAGDLDAATLNKGRLAESSLKALDFEDIYAYTFATPKGVLLENVEALEKQNNIFNTVLDTDLVTYITPAKDYTAEGSGWDFARYGVDVDLSIMSASDELINKVKTNFDSYELADLNYVPAKEVNKKIFTMSAESDDNLKPIQKVSPVEAIKSLLQVLSGTDENGGKLTREKFAYCQDSLRALTSFIFSMSEEERNTFQEGVTTYLTNNGLELIFSVVPEIMGLKDKEAPTSETKCADYCPNTHKMVSSIFEGLGLNSEDNMAQIELHLPHFSYLISGIIPLLFVDSEHECKIMTVLKNSDSITVTHYPEVYRAWIEAGK